MTSCMCRQPSVQTNKYQRIQDTCLPRENDKQTARHLYIQTAVCADGQISTHTQVNASLERKSKVNKQSSAHLYVQMISCMCRQTSVQICDRQHIRTYLNLQMQELRTIKVHELGNYMYRWPAARTDSRLCRLVNRVRKLHTQTDSQLYRQIGINAYRVHLDC